MSEENRVHDLISNTDVFIFTKYLFKMRRVMRERWHQMINEILFVKSSIHQFQFLLE